MKTQIVITDLTRMYRGMVCIAGYDKAHRCIRPVASPPGIPERSLVVAGRPIVFPFAIVELDLLQPTPNPPHTEDYRFDLKSLSFVPYVTDREKVLQWSVFENVGAIFEQPVHSDFGFYVMDCRGARSLGTIQPEAIVQVRYEPEREGDAWDYRIHFYDPNDDFYRLKITDLTWHYYCDSLRGRGLEPITISADLTKMLRSRKVYLRIGLARGWKKFPDRCYLQVNGIYTFPDYLEGRTFADFYPVT